MILFAKLCYGLPHCGCKLCYQPPLKRLSEVNFISFADIENEDVETAHEMDNISYKETGNQIQELLACQRNFKKKNICILFFLIFASTARFFERCLFLIGGLVRTHKVMLIILVGKKTSTQCQLSSASEL